MRNIVRNELIRALLRPTGKLRVLDVGALGGLKEPWSGSSDCIEAVCIEPLDAKGEGSQVMFGLGEAAGEQDFYITRKPDASSILRPNAEVLSRYGGSSRFEVVQTARIRLETLDAFMHGKSGEGNIGFLKLDTQGSELAILRGATHTLRGVLGLDIEVNFLKRYVGQDDAVEIFGFLRDQGFSIFDFQRRYAKRAGLERVGQVRGQMMHGTALFLRTPEALMETVSGMEPVERLRTMRQAAAIYVAYGYVDSAVVLLRYGIDQGWDEGAAPLIERLTVIRPISDMIPRFFGRGRMGDLAARFARMLHKPSVSGIAGDDSLRARE